jgi:predicted ATPase
VHDPALLLQADHALGVTLVYLGDLAPARVRLEQGIALYDVQHHHAQTVLYGGHDPGVCCLVHAAWVLWLLGYPAQARMRGQEAHALARLLAHPFSVTHALQWTAMLAQFCRDIPTTQDLTEAARALALEQGFAGYTAGVTLIQGWAQVHQGQEEGMTQIMQGLAALRAMGSEYLSTYYLGLLAEAYGHVGNIEAGLRVLTEALAAAHTTGVRYYEAELHRLRGALLLQQAAAPQEDAEKSLQQALDVARRQQAKSLELRAAMSLSRLWQQQGKGADARALLAPIYGWFTEGFDTADLQEAQALLEELGA